MKLIDLELKNFRQHLDAQVSFVDGVTGIIGSNGSGKSTILEAIAWALYGAPAVRGTNDTVRSKASEGGAKVSVALTFELGGSVYRAARTLDASGRSGSAVLEVDGRPLRSGMSEASEAVTKLLGMDYRAFFTSFFTGQKQLEFMAQLDGRARAAAISRMLGYDRLIKARDQANKDRLELHKLIEGWEQGLADPEDLKRRRGKAEAELAAANKALEGSEAVRKTGEAALEKLKPLKEVSDQKARRHQELTRRLELDKSDVARSETRLAQLRAELADLANKRKELDSLKGDLAKFDAAGQEFKVLRGLQEHEGDRQRLSGQISSAEQDVRRLEARARQLASADEQQTRASLALAEAEKMLVAADEKLRASRESKIAHEHGLQAQIAHLEEHRQQVGAKRSQIESAGAEGKCPTCERPLADELAVVLANFDSQITDTSARIESLAEEKRKSEADNSALALLQTDREKLAAQVDAMRNEKTKADALVAERGTLRKDIEARSADLATVRDQLAKLPGGFDQARFRALQKIGDELKPVRDRAIALRSALEREEQVASESEELAGSVENRKAEITAAEKALAELGFSAEAHGKLTVEFDSATTDLNAAMLQFERQRGEVMTATAILTAVKREEDALKSRQEELKAKKSERLHLQALTEALDKLRTELNDRIRPELESIAGELLSTMTDGRYNSLEIDEKSYEAVIRDDGELKPVISGGEEDVVNLSLRLAISQMIADRAGQSFSLLVLDEVFGSLDDVRRDNVVALLQNLKNRFEQIILITHVESIHDAVDNCLWVYFDERTKTSRLTDRSDEFRQSAAGLVS